MVETSNSQPTIYYVGCTSKTLTVRRYGHLAAALQDKQAPVFEWVRSLLRENVEPEIRLLEECTRQTWEAREKHWIKLHQGPDLTNVSTGGSGAPGAYPNREQRAKAVSTQFKGKPLTAEHKAKLSAVKMGHEMMPHVIEALRQANLGKKQSKRTIERRKQTMLANPHRHTEEAKAKISAAHKGRKMGPLSDQAKDKLSKTISNLIWINNGIQSKRIQKGAIPDGWMTGRLGRT